MHPLTPTRRIRASSSAPWFLPPALLELLQPMQDERDDDGRDGLPKAAPSSRRVEPIRLTNRFWGARPHDCAQSQHADVANSAQRRVSGPRNEGPASSSRSGPAVGTRAGRPDAAHPAEPRRTHPRSPTCPADQPRHGSQRSSPLVVVGHAFQPSCCPSVSTEPISARRVREARYPRAPPAASTTRSASRSQSRPPPRQNPSGSHGGGRLAPTGLAHVPAPPLQQRDRILGRSPSLLLHPDSARGDLARRRPLPPSRAR